MAPIFRTVGLILLLPFAVIFARYLAVPYGSNPGPVSTLLLVYGGYFILAAYAISFVAIGYQLSKRGVGSILTAGLACVVAYVVLSLFAFVMWRVVSGMSPKVSTEFAYVAPIVGYLIGAFLLGAGGFLLHARVKATAI